MTSNSTKSGLIEISNELKDHLSEEKYRKFEIEKAFIRWYIFARFGIDNEKSFVITDGKNDGGIDAILDYKGMKYVLQTKYEKVPRKSSVLRSDVSQTEKVDALLKNLSDLEFNEWLNTTRDELHSLYRGLRKTSNDRIRVCLITTKHCPYKSNSILIEDLSKIAPLWTLYKEDSTPPCISLVLNMDGSWYEKFCAGYNTYVGLADTNDFMKIMDNDENESLFAQNVRTKKNSPINVDIKKSYAKEPENFWLGNNGIYIICKKVTKENKQFSLEFPSIINGSQTLHSIHSSTKRHKCSILVRILEMSDNNNELLSQIIRRTNQQNPMKLVNLFARDPFQRHIARFLNSYQIFYERREGEWKNEKKLLFSNHYCIRIKDVAQWASASYTEIGIGTARSRVSTLFSDANYPKIFGNYDDNFASEKYAKLSTAVWAGIFVNQIARALPKQFKANMQISRLFFIKAIYESITFNNELSNLINQSLKEHKFTKKLFTVAFLAAIKRDIVNLRKLQKNAQSRQENIDFSNFFKSDEYCNFAYSKLITKKRMKEFVLHLTKMLNS